MNERRRSVHRACHWKMLLSAIGGGFVGAGASDLVPRLLADRTDPWLAGCESMMERNHRTGRGWQYYTNGEICVTVVHPQLADREAALDADPDFLNSDVIHTVLDAHKPALRDSGTDGELRVRLLVNGEGAVAVSEVVQSTGHTAMEAFAIELAGALSFTPGMKDDVATSTEMEFSVAMRVRD